MKAFFITTVGTSILANVERLNISEIPEKYRDIIRGSSRLRVDDERQKEFERRAYPESELFKIVYDYVCKSPREYSAELNALLGFIDRKYMLLRSAEVLEFNLYSTDTGTGFFCAKVIEKWIRERLAQEARLSESTSVLVNEPVKLKRFGWGYEFFPEALVDVVDKVAKVIVSKRRQGFKVYVNATAGFKVETTYLTITSLMFKADSVFYVHEATHEVVELPALPLSISEPMRSLLRELRTPTQRQVAELIAAKHGVSLDELKERGLIDSWDGMVQAREWVRRLLEVE